MDLAAADAGSAGHSMHSIQEDPFHHATTAWGGAVEIVPGLFLGPGAPARVWPPTQLQKLKITHIVKCLPDDLSEFDEFLYAKVPIEDDPKAPIILYIEHAHDFVDAAIARGGRVYVHCNAGISRSPTVVISYLMRRRGMTLKAAFEHVRARRPQAAPNAGFFSFLCSLERELYPDAPPSFPLIEYKVMMLKDFAGEEVPEGVVREKLAEAGGELSLAQMKVLDCMLEIARATSQGAAMLAAQARA